MSGRRKKERVIETPGRDKGKIFILTEMDAIRGDRWATQASRLIADALVAGAAAEAAASGMAGLAVVAQPVLGNSASMTPSQVQEALRISQALQDPSLDEWWGCVQFQPANRALAPQFIIQGDGCQIEEISTITLLRRDVLDLHLGFFTTESTSTTKMPSPVRKRKGSFGTPM